jgi:starch synthase
MHILISLSHIIWILFPRIDMHIIHIASEITPIAKLGGLADVVHGLSKQCIQEGHTVEVIIPKYGCVDLDLIENLKKTSTLISYEGSRAVNNEIWQGINDTIPVTLIDPELPYFTRDQIYGYPDDVRRFCYFAKTALEYLYKMKKKPDVLHLHDWPAALVAPLYTYLFSKIGLNVGKIVLTIHNLEHQGITSPALLGEIGAPIKDQAMMEKLQDPSEPKLVNLLRGGIECADRVTTVSPTYRDEILTAKEHKLYTILQQHKKKITGILNGIDDTSFWNPISDPYLSAHYNTKNVSDKDFDKIVEGKRKNRTRLCNQLNLKLDHAPLIASITRLVSQKAPHLIVHALHKTLEHKGQFILLGSTPTKDVEKEFLDLKLALVDNRNVAICLNKDEEIAHLIYAAADMILVPSIFEPCGLTQIIAMRYGTVPIVRKTGGLADTVFDAKNGFSFTEATFHGLDSGLERALDCFQHRDQWKKIVMNGVAADFSWHNSVKEYLKVYSS